MCCGRGRFAQSDAFDRAECEIECLQDENMRLGRIILSLQAELAEREQQLELAQNRDPLPPPAHAHWLVSL